MYACVCVCSCTCMFHVCVHVCEDQETTLFLETGTLTGLKLAN